MIFQPEISFKIRSRGEKTIYILVDTSCSMGIKDTDGKTRLEKVKNFIDNTYLFKNFHSVFYTFGNEIGKFTKKEIFQILPNHNSSLIGKSLKKIQNESEQNCAGIIIFTDGGESEFLPFDELKKTLKHPVYPIGIGENKLKDISINYVITNSPVFSGENIQIEVYLKQNGFDGQRIKVRLKKEDKVISEKTIKLSGNMVRINFEIPQEKTGDFLYEVEVLPETEQIIENNRTSVLVRVLSPKIRILYVEGSLRWEYKFLKRHLESGLHLEPVFLVKVGENIFQQTGAGKKREIPADIFGDTKFLDHFEIIILGNIDFSFFTSGQFHNLKNFVSEQGKSLIFLGGEHFMKGIKNSPLEEILPIHLTGSEEQVINESFIPSFTEAGKHFPAFENFSSFPSLGRINDVKKIKKGSQALLVAEKEKSPLILLTLNPGLKGKCLILGTDETWKWSFGKEQDKKMYHLFWGRIIRYMWSPENYLGIGETLPEIIPDRKIYGKGEKVNVTFVFKSGTKQKIKAFLKTPEGKKILFSTKNNTASFTAEEEGIYLVEAVEPNFDDIRLRQVKNGREKNIKEIIVKKEGAEFNEPERNETFLKKIAEISGGEYFPFEKVSRLEKTLAEKKKKIIHKNLSVSRNSRKFLIPVVLLFLNLSIRNYDILN